MSTLHKIPEIRDPQGGRNFIREGDDVKVLAGPGNKQTYLARFLYGEIDEEGNLVQVSVYGAKGERAPLTRIFRPERLQRVAQTKSGEKVSRTRGADQDQ